MSRTEAGPVRMIGTLGIAGLLSGLTLVGVHLVTAPRIQRNRAEAMERAIYRVLPGARSREAYALRDGRLTPLDAISQTASGETLVYAGYDAAGARVGFAIPAQGPGFQDTIKLLYGYVPERRLIVGMEILESRETPGLGDRIFKDAAFVANFHDLAVDPRIQMVKGGRTLPHEVDAISGATISSQAVVRILTAANDRWLEWLTMDGQQAPEPGTTEDPEGVR